MLSLLDILMFFLGWRAESSWTAEVADSWTNPATGLIGMTGISKKLTLRKKNCQCQTNIVWLTTVIYLGKIDLVTILRTLSALADAFDEHMLLVRMADEECFDIIKLHSGLSRLLAH